MTIMLGKGQYIAGNWHKSTGAVLESIDPANGAIIWQGPQATAAEIEQAVLQAAQTLPCWAQSDFEYRQACVQEFGKIVEQNQTALSQLIALETGKPLWEAKTEVTAVINKVAISLQAYKERTWPKIEANGCLRYKAQGVIAVLGAYNFPAHISHGHIIPALLAGNTLIYKPSEYTPAVAERLMEFWDATSLPKGVLQCIQGSAEVGTTLLKQDIQGVYFTGSYKTGLAIHQQFAEKPEVILALEMGGNNPLVIDEITDMRAAVYNTLLSTLLTAGQRCSCVRRLILPNNATGDNFLHNYIKACTKLKIGRFDSQPEPFIGPIISHKQAQNALTAQQSLLELGGTSLLPMQILAKNTGFLSPGIIDMTGVNAVPDDEIFAPLLQVYRYTDLDEAITLANQTRYGLTAGIFTDKKAHYQQFYNQVRAGLINWNRPTTGALSTLPFGGVGRSGNHRASAYFAADYCSYPVASMEQSMLTTPEQILPGIAL